MVSHVDGGLMVGKDKNKMLEVLKQLDEEFKISHYTGEENFSSHLVMHSGIFQDSIFINQSILKGLSLKISILCIHLLKEGWF